MDLGLKGKNAVVTASSAGLGYACALELARAGANVVINGCDEEALLNAARGIRRSTGSNVCTVLGDVSVCSVQDALLSAAPQIDMLVSNNSGLPFRDLSDVKRTSVVSSMAASTQGFQSVVEGMADRRFGRIVAITSSQAIRPLEHQIREAAFLAGIARSVAHANVTVNYLLAGSFDTEQLQTAHDIEAEMRGVPIEEVAEQARIAIPARRFGTPSEFGAVCAFICSKYAGYITGQSLLINGGGQSGML